MVKDEKVLEELYELLGLYFAINLPGGVIASGFKDCKNVEPALDKLIFQEKIFARITSLIVGGE